MKKKIEIHYVLKKLLVKTIIVFTSVYFEPYCKIPNRSKIINTIAFLPQNSYPCKGILNKKKKI